MLFLNNPLIKVIKQCLHKPFQQKKSFLDISQQTHVSTTVNITGKARNGKTDVNINVHAKMARQASTNAIHCKFAFLCVCRAQVAQPEVTGCQSRGGLDFTPSFANILSEVNVTGIIHLPPMAYKSLWKSSQLIGQTVVWSTGVRKPNYTLASELAIMMRLKTALNSNQSIFLLIGLSSSFRHSFNLIIATERLFMISW